MKELDVIASPLVAFYNCFLLQTHNCRKLAFVPEESISSERVAQYRISAMRIVGISGIVGFDLVVVAFIIETRTRRFSQP